MVGRKKWSEPLSDSEQILVLGARGKLGRALLQTDPACASWPEDQRMPGQGPEAFFSQLSGLITQRRPRRIINCLAYTNVDGAEAEPELASLVNGASPGLLARACASVDCHLIHISTDFVFDGRLSRPYQESDEPSPLSAYAQGKLEGERLVSQAHPGALVARTAWLFGPYRTDFVQKMLLRAGRGEPLRIVSDQVGSPSYTLDVAQALVDLSRRRVSGLVHVVNSGQASRLELVRQALNLMGLDPDLAQGIPSQDLPLPAPRPAWSVLDGRRLARLRGGPMPTWLDGLRRFLSGKSWEKLIG